MNITRLEKIIVVSLLGFILILCYYQIIKGDYFFTLSEKYRIRVIPLLAKRGDILDRNGKPLATQKPILNIVINPQELNDKERILKELGRILEIPYEKILKKYSAHFISPYYPFTLIEDIPLEKVFLIEERKPELNGVEIEMVPVRFYPFGSLGAHILGYIGEISSEELSYLKPYGYKIKNMVGKMGIEKAMDVYLRGENGGKQVEVDNMGKIVRIIGEKKPIQGKEIKLTLNKEWQEKAHLLLNEQAGAIIIMDVRNGEILVMESSPSFDPNIFITREEKVKSILRSPKAPLLNRATKANLPPGSIFKLVTGMAGLSYKTITPYTSYKCEGRFYLGNEEFRCWAEEGHGFETITEAIRHSCNIFFYKLGLELGIEKMKNFANLLGLGEETGIEIEENIGFIPTPKWKQIKLKERWFEGDTVNLSIGQGYLLVTPLQILRLIACIANGGYLIKPHLIKSIDGIQIEEMVREYTGIAQNVLKVIKEGMFKVVNEPGGTGIRAKVAELEISAKTATVQTAKGKTHALIAGFLPYKNPKLCFVIFLEHGGGGGVEAADLCFKLFSSLKKEIIEYQ